MEPVLPRSAIFIIFNLRGFYTVSEKKEDQRDKEGTEQNSVYPVHNPAVSRHNSAHILDADPALYPAFEQIARLGEKRRNETYREKYQPLAADAEVGPENKVQRGGARRRSAGSVILPLPHHDVELYTSGRF